MNRRSFLKNSTLVSAAGLLWPKSLQANVHEQAEAFGKHIAKNIIFMVSDGMSLGTLSLTDTYLQRKNGSGSHWLNLYRSRQVTRTLMETASANSLVTDSAAASSSWGGGARVNNGSLNVGPDGKNYQPIWQKCKAAGKKVGCVTTVPITHATPAGFCINAASRQSQADIADLYLPLQFDVMLGGGLDYFSKNSRKDQADRLTDYQQKGYQVVLDRDGMMQAQAQKPLLGVFDRDALPYQLDLQQDATAQKQIPSLAEMTQTALRLMADHPKGFALQVESGKVDWAAHANDIGALIHEQIAFDKAVEVALAFVKGRTDTLLVITTDHGNANPGLIYGKEANDHFDQVMRFTRTNEWLLNAIDKTMTPAQVRDLLQQHLQIAPSVEEANQLLKYYSGLEKEEAGLYNYKKLPYKYLSEWQKKYTSVGWISMDHSADYVELAATGPGSEKLPAWIKNYEIHQWLLEAAAIEV